MNWFGKTRAIIAFPSHLKTDDEGFNFLAYLQKETEGKLTYVLDFSSVEWVEANLCAVIGAIILYNQTKGAYFEFENLNNNYLKNTLKNNGFLELIKKGKTKSTHKHSGIPFKEFDMKDEDMVEEYIYKYVLLSDEVPEMSEAAKRKIYRSIFEVYQNSVIHSGAEKVFVCGQFYRYKKRMALTMVEIGRTFKQNVNEYSKEYENYSAIESIEWAVQSGNSTKKDSTPGGLGIDLIREFLKLNRGKLQIFSSNGYWEEKKGTKFVKHCVNPFAGSIVNIEFNLFDTNTYISTEEIDIKDIL
ncbi:MAG: hypothetical protein CMC96_00310 [Flavobacteriales bacterium]|nr:hypothetical protein [Flavobacteriales bacterium]|tara:strand:- start:61224 stop:62126 length:903 start_codon:yes stop_codon:yes gene_type:complete